MTSIDELFEFRQRVFNIGAPSRTYVKLLYDSMRWPADHWLTCAHDNEFGGHDYEAHWISGQSIGTWSLTTRAVGDEPEPTAVLRAVATVTHVDIGASVHQDGIELVATPWAIIHFAHGRHIGIDLREHSGWRDPEHAAAFMAAVLDLVAGKPIIRASTR